ncbi:MAG: hypothetical protein MUP22_13740 [Desulfobacterales bacterium]|nr:hypothetical protein [Desulfobacterales bacterium]
MDELKDKVQVIIFTRQYRIKGYIAQFSNTRLTDYIVESKSFIAVTDAEVMDLGGNKIFATPFLNVQRDSIEIITPADIVKMEIL